MPFNGTTKPNQRPNHLVKNGVSFQAGVMNCLRKEAASEKQFSVPIQLPPFALILEKKYLKHKKNPKKPKKNICQPPETPVFAQIWNHRS